VQTGKSVGRNRPHEPLPLKPTHAPVKTYYAALVQFHLYGHERLHHAGAARIAEAFKLDRLPEVFVLSPDNYDVAPTTYQPVIRADRKRVSLRT
jgi:hypothetical protein